MKRTKFLFLAILGTGLLFTSCKSSGEKGDTAKSEQNNKAEKSCVYQYDNSTSEIGFTAYKFTKKAGVPGVFDEFTITGAKKDADPLNVIENLKVSIPVASINTNNPVRDSTIVKYFFDALPIDTISASIMAINAESNTLSVLINMNNVGKVVKCKYTLSEDGKFSFSTDIDVNDWGEGKGITSLNNQCKDLHTGEDGISKLWPDVSISFTTQLKKECK